MPQVNYANVRRWTCKSRPLSRADVIVIPVNECNHHWLLILVSVSRKEIVLLDRCASGPGMARRCHCCARRRHCLISVLCFVKSTVRTPGGLSALVCSSARLSAVPSMAAVHGLIFSGPCCSLYCATRAGEYRQMMLAVWAWLLCEVHDKHCVHSPAAADGRVTEPPIAPPVSPSVKPQLPRQARRTTRHGRLMTRPCAPRGKVAQGAVHKTSSAGGPAVPFVRSVPGRGGAAGRRGATEGPPGAGAAATGVAGEPGVAAGGGWTCCNSSRAWQKGWKLRVAVGVPQQDDGGSCGALLLAYADCALRGWWPDQPLDFLPGREAELRLGILRTLRGSR